MKLCFSTKGWHQNCFEEFCDIAVDLGFKGIELHNIYNRLFAEKDGAFHDYAAAATMRRLYEKNLKLPCIDTISDDEGFLFFFTESSCNLCNKVTFKVKSTIAEKFF